MIPGIEIVVSKAIGPLLVELARGATGPVKAALKQWMEADYAKKLALKLAVADRVKTLWSPDEETSLLNIYFPSKISVNHKPGQKIDSLRDFPPGNVVIEGIVGHGKSIFLRYLCLQELAGNGTGTLPLFLELRTLTAKKGLQDKIFESMDKLDITATPEIFDYLAKSGKMTLLLDGFDELEENLTLETINHLEYLIEKYPMLRIIVTSRPSNEIQKSRLMRVVTLCGLRKEDHTGFLRKLGLDTGKIQDIIDAITRSSTNVSTLITTPLMLTLLVLVYESEREIPSELSDFFERLFATMFTRHDRLKAAFNRKHYSGLPESRLQKLFETFCFLTLKNRHGRTLSSADFSMNFEKAKDVTKEAECSEINFKADIIKVSCLMLEEGFDSINFLHKSIPEFFAAAFINRLSEDAAKKFYEKAISDPEPWKASLSFLQKIDSYRYEKFYNLIRHERFLVALGTNINQPSTWENWKTFLIKNYSDFGVGYGSDSHDPLMSLTAQTWGPYDSHETWGGTLQEEFVQTLMGGLEEDMPGTISRATATDETNNYLPAVSRDEEYHLHLEKIFNIYSLPKTYQRFQIFERKIWRAIDSSKTVIQDEDYKGALVEDDIV